MAYSGRKCTWCGQAELRPETPEEFEKWLELPRGCCAPDGDGHLWVFPHGYSWNNPPPNFARTRPGLRPGEQRQ